MNKKDKIELQKTIEALRNSTNRANDALDKSHKFCTQVQKDIADIKSGKNLNKPNLTIIKNGKA